MAESHCIRKLQNYDVQKTAEHMTWRRIKDCCRKPNRPGYVGDKGIRVFPKWIESFSTFLQDVGKRPTRQHSLVRIDDGRNYEPGNVEWRLRSMEVVGVRFGRLVGVEDHGDGFCLARCDCGTSKKIWKWSMRSGATTSCGCYRHERIAKPHGVAAFNALFGKYKRDAARRGLVFRLTEDEFRHLTSSPCTYCGVESSNNVAIQYNFFNGTYRYNGVDRVNNLVGYVRSNCVPCCKQCNFAKGNMKRKDFEAWISRIASFNRKDLLYGTAG